jgi:hypothetical protein
MTDSAKLDRLIAQMSTVITRLDSHDRRISRTEKARACDDDVLDNETALPEGERPPPGGGAGGSGGSGGGGGGGGGFGAGFGGGGRDNGFGRGYGGPREPKLSFPRFDGESDPLPWLNKCDGFFRGYRTLEEDKVWLASLHLDGAAALWYIQLERDLGIVSWPRFAEYANLRFGPPIRSNTLGELKDLQRTGTVEEYQRQFLALLCRCENLTRQHQIDLFTSGLGQPLASDVELQRPANLQTAMSLARAYERRSAEAARAIHPSASRPAARQRSQTLPAAPVAPPQKSDGQKPDEQARPRVRRLSPEEIAEKRANGQLWRLVLSYKWFAIVIPSVSYYLSSPRYILRNFILLIVT